MTLAPRSNAPRVVRKPPKRTSDNSYIDGRRKCVVCVTPIGDAPRTFYNHKGSIGMAHTTCVPKQEETGDGST